MTEAELKKHLDLAEKSPKEIAAAVLGLPDKTLRYRLSPDKWCILEILAHLADIEILYAYRMRQMLADKDPVHRADRSGRMGEESGIFGIVAAGAGRPLRIESPCHSDVVAPAEGERLAEICASS